MVEASITLGWVRDEIPDLPEDRPGWALIAQIDQQTFDDEWIAAVRSDGFDRLCDDMTHYLVHTFSCRATLRIRRGGRTPVATGQHLPTRPPSPACGG
jgi:hypothetical protein